MTFSDYKCWFNLTFSFPIYLNFMTRQYLSTLSFFPHILYKFFAVGCLCIKRVQLRTPTLLPAVFCIVILLYLPLSKK